MSRFTLLVLFTVCYEFYSLSKRQFRRYQNRSIKVSYHGMIFPSIRVKYMYFITSKSGSSNIPLRELITCRTENSNSS